MIEHWRETLVLLYILAHITDRGLDFMTYVEVEVTNTAFSNLSPVFVILTILNFILILLRVMSFVLIMNLY